ncbi:MAG TPA: ABC transporter permease, partial [Candidatus Acidoferrum sp.]|nr:ABC transporter permease [Candidatus Acidoferrum sp.]
PAFTIIAVIALGLGMAVNATIFSVINGMLLRPMPVPHAEQLTVLAMEQPGMSGLQKFSYPVYQDISRQTGVFSDVFAYRITLAALSAEHKVDQAILTRVTGNYFSTLGIQAESGRLILPSEGQTPGADPILVLGYSYWKKRFAGDSKVIGKHVEINGHPFTVVGVAPKGFHGTYSILDSDGYLPLSAALGSKGMEENSVEQLWTQRSDRSLSLLGRLKSGVSLKQAQASLSVTAQQISKEYPDTEKGVTITAFPEKLARPDPDPDNTLPKIAAAFTILAGLVLLVACFNIANVLLVRATVRQREMGIRAALGAGRWRLVRQHLTESMLLALLGGGAGLLLANWAAGYLSSLPLGTNLPITIDFQPDLRVYLYALASVLVSSVVVGLIPALRVARCDVNSVLREGGRTASEGRRRHIARNTLVVAQVAGALLLLIVAGLFVRSLDKAQQIYLGFDPDHVLNFSLDAQQVGFDKAHGAQFFRQVDERIRAIPGVVSVAQGFVVPMGVVSTDDPVTVEGRPFEPGEHVPTVMYNDVTPSYFDTLRMHILSGRTFTEADNEKAPAVAIINQTMAKQFWSTENVLGKRFSIKGPAGPFIEVVGVVQDGKYKSIVEEPMAFFYLPLNQVYVDFRTVHVRTSARPEKLERDIESSIQALAPDIAVKEMQTMLQSLQGLNGFFLFRFGAQLTTTMGLLGLILAVVGVYSVVSYAAVQRTHEIGIRMALGAAPRDIQRMVLRQSVVIVGVGLTVGLAAALAGTRAIASFIVGVHPTDAVTFVTVVVLLAVVALVACWIPARRATRVSPLVALRYE